MTLTKEDLEEILSMIKEQTIIHDCPADLEEALNYARMGWEMHHEGKVSIRLDNLKRFEPHICFSEEEIKWMELEYIDEDYTTDV